MYTEYQPCGLLSAYIDKYWVFKGKTELGTYFKILPDGCCGLYLFHWRHCTMCRHEPAGHATLSLLLRRSDDYFLGIGHEHAERSHAGSPFPSLRVNRFLQTASL